MPLAIASRGDAKSHRCAVDPDFARVRVVEAVKHFHQSALARPVLAEQRQNLAGANLKIDIVVSGNGAELLADAGHDHQRRPASPSFQGEDAIDLDGGAARQIGDTDGGSRMRAVGAEQFVHEIGRAVDDLRDFVELRTAIDEAAEAYARR